MAAGAGAHRLFGWWLYPSGRSRRMATLVGTFVVVTLYGLSLALTRPISEWTWP